ncbi:unnamed protein product, partial [Mesorhabditis spiculigera]
MEAQNRLIEAVLARHNWNITYSMPSVEGLQTVTTIAEFDMTLLLSAISIADILFFIHCVPDFLTTLQTMYTHPYFRRFYYASHFWCHTGANVFAATSSWLMVGVAVERYAAIRTPFHTRLQSNHVRALAVFSLVGASLLSAYRLFEGYYDYTEVSRSKAGLSPYCFLVFEYARRKRVPAVQPFGQGLLAQITNHDVIGWAKWLSVACFVVPYVLILLLNIGIVYELRRRPDSSGNQRLQDRAVTGTIFTIFAWNLVTDFWLVLPFLWELLIRTDRNWSTTWMVPSWELRLFLTNIFFSLDLNGKVLNVVCIAWYQSRSGRSSCECCKNIGIA